MNRIYISGPISNMQDYNFPAFNAMARDLRADGHDVINPAELDAGKDPASLKWSDCLRRDLSALMLCDTIVMLPGWSESRGAQLEHHVACELGFTVIYPVGWL